MAIVSQKTDARNEYAWAWFTRAANKGLVRDGTGRVLCPIGWIPEAFTTDVADVQGQFPVVFNTDRMPYWATHNAQYYYDNTVTGGNITTTATATTISLGKGVVSEEGGYILLEMCLCWWTAPVWVNSPSLPPSAPAQSSWYAQSVANWWNANWSTLYTCWTPMLVFLWATSNIPTNYEIRERNGISETVIWTMTHSAWNNIYTIPSLPSAWNHTYRVYWKNWATYSSIFITIWPITVSACPLNKFIFAVTNSGVLRIIDADTYVVTNATQASTDVKYFNNELWIPVWPWSNQINFKDTSFTNIATTNVGTQNSSQTAYWNGKWAVTNFYSHTVTIIDWSTHAVIATVPTGTYPEWVAYGNGYFMVANSWNSTGNTVTVINSTTLAVVSTIIVDTYPRCIWYGWWKFAVGCHTNNSISIIDDTSLTVTSVINSVFRPVGILYAWWVRWVANRVLDTATFINAATNAIIATTAVWAWPSWIAYWNGKRAISNTNSSNTTIIDWSTYAVLATATWWISWWWWYGTYV